MPKVGEYEINLAGQLPAEERCGLATIYGELIRHPEQLRFAVIAFDVSWIKVPTDPGDAKAPTLRIKRWEVAAAGETGDEQAMLELIDRINGRRLGETTGQATLATTAELDGERDAAASAHGDHGDRDGDPDWPEDHPATHIGRPDDGNRPTGDPGDDQPGSRTGIGRHSSQDPE